MQISCGFKPIVETIGLVIPFSLISIILSLLSVHEDFSIENFSPFFGYNFQTTFLNGLLNIFSLYIINYYFFIKPFLKNNCEFKKITIISYIMSWTLLFFTVISLLNFFSNTSVAEPINSLYILSRQIELGNFLQRIDGLFVLLWIISMFCYLSFTIFLTCKIFTKIFNISNQKNIILSIVTIFFGLCILPLNISYLTFLENTIYRYLIIFITFVFEPILLIIANIKYKLKKGKNKQKS